MLLILAISFTMKPRLSNPKLKQPPAVLPRPRNGTGAWVPWRLAAARPDESVRWECVDGSWVTVSLGHGSELGRVVVAHSDEDAVQWVHFKGRTLGEMTPSASRNVVDKLLKLGAVAVHACKIDSYEDGTENTGHLVVELPNTQPARSALLKHIDRLARKQGHAGDLDDGQKYAYLKLD